MYKEKMHKVVAGDKIVDEEEHTTMKKYAMFPEKLIERSIVKKCEDDF